MRKIIVIMGLLVLLTGCKAASGTAGGGYEGPAGPVQSAVAGNASPPAASPPAAPSSPAGANAAQCTQAGGDFVADWSPFYAPEGHAECANITYLGSDSKTYDIDLPYPASGGDITPAAEGSSTTATESQCEAGQFPDGPAGLVSEAPGDWDGSLQLCLPSPGDAS